MNALIRAIKYTPYQTLSMMLVLTLSLFLILSAVASMMFAYSFLNYLEGRPNVIVYFQLKTPESTIMDAKRVIQNTSLTTQVKYISSNEALSIYKKFNADDPELFELINAENLPASLEIRAIKPEHLNQIANIMKSQAGVEDVQFQKTTITRLLSFTKGMRATATTLIIVLLIISTLVLMTLTAFKIALKKDEIYLLQLLGATKDYIIGPYLSEAFMAGLVSAFLAWGVFFMIIVYLEPNVSNFFLGVNSLSTPLLKQLGIITYPPNWLFYFSTFVIASFLGVATSLLGTFLAAYRYIRG